uniref:Peptide-methionine (R)-S-oxide reductase n=1 Tax=Minutocellus polymorphus TaxID=265543 RepID=A0A7S0AFQ0_9STRA|mmetsp:Transcript_12606/g.20991  ORF Transcript_12606/g.20991 Transcript_12606/m.20991 type:complete len:314 (+) Transcript_12606:79-1020(+)
MTTTLLPALLSLLVLAADVSAAGQQQCYGIDPQPDLVNFLGAELSYDTADHICCHNHRLAEYRGYLEAPEVRLFDKLDPTVEHVFYDSVCGLPLFVAPRGRTFEEFQEESIHHGWPSFRPAEIISENVIIHDDGRMESRCKTHLGHNLPKGGVDRYCIDLVCIAGAPLTTDDAMYKSLVSAGAPIGVVEQDDMMNGSGGDGDMNDPYEKGNLGGVITADQLDTETYVSSAEEFSGKYNDWKRNVAIAAATVGSLLVVLFAFFCFRKKCSKKKKPDNAGMAARKSVVAVGEEEGKMLPEETNDDSSGTHSNEDV